MPKRNLRLYTQDILESIEAIESYITLISLVQNKILIIRKKEIIRDNE